MEKVSPITTAELAAFVARLGAFAPAADDAERIDRLALLERAKSGMTAAQAAETVDFKRSQLEAQVAAGVPTRDRGKGVNAQVALARRVSPHRAARLVGMAEALVGEMPHTLAALAAGEINEWRAMIAVRETACLTREDRATADAELADRLATMGDRQIEAEFKRIAYRLDPYAFVERQRRAESERNVSTRPAPDVMCYLTALLPVKQGIAALAALKRHADTKVSEGDERSRGQIMADTLVERLTGQSVAGQVPVEVQLVISAESLAGASDEPAHLQGHGPVPAPWARELVRNSGAAVWIRRLYTEHGRLVAMEATQRLFPDGLRRFIVARDQVCRTPWCDAPIRHIDHPLSYEAGGKTAETNGQGLCVTCNHAKEGHRWKTRAGPSGAGDRVITTTPTGHRYTSRPPTRDDWAAPSLEAYFNRMVLRFVA
ncbi:MAG TPA: DUF222 domain-containing protein [Nocardioidaceae bacterium]|nr:DUF222 domain-containing protein [Nocardioidaceae bacterium]